MLARSIAPPLGCSRASSSGWSFGHLSLAEGIVRVSSCNIQVSSFQVSNQDPGQGFKLQFPSLKFQTRSGFHVAISKFSSFKPRSRTGFQVAISKFQDSNQDPGQGFKLQSPSFKIHTKIQVRVSRCNFQVSRFTPRSRSGLQDAISKFQDSHQDPGQGFKMQFLSFKIHTKIQVRVSRCNFQVSRFTPSVKFQFLQFSSFQSFKIHTKHSNNFHQPKTSRSK